MKAISVFSETSVNTPYYNKIVVRYYDKEYKYNANTDDIRDFIDELGIIPLSKPQRAKINSEIYHLAIGLFKEHSRGIAEQRFSHDMELLEEGLNYWYAQKQVDEIELMKDDICPYTIKRIAIISNEPKVM